MVRQFWLDSVKVSCPFCHIAFEVPEGWDQVKIKEGMQIWVEHHYYPPLQKTTAIVCPNCQKLFKLGG